MDRHRTAFLQKNTQKITTRPGVYLYEDTSGNVLYVGKAKNLRNRIRQYFTRGDAIEAKTTLLVARIASVRTIPTENEVAALLLEAALIRKYLPKYNAVSRDDKSPLYIVITFDERLPRMYSTRKSSIDAWQPMPKRRFIAGPFQSGRVARLLMQSIRHIIPFCTQKRRDGSPCFYTHLGLCNPCPSAIGNDLSLTRVYRSNLRRIALLLSGHALTVRRHLERAMRSCARRLAFEEAHEYKRQLASLDMLLTRSFDPSLYTDQASEPTLYYQTRVRDLSDTLRGCGMPLATLERIECIDISSMHGQWATGSLVVFTKGLPDSNQYRRFRIKKISRLNDVDMMAEVVMRRFSHHEWPYPGLLIVDGGKGQIRAARPAPVAVIGLAKRFEEIIVPMGEAFKTVRLPLSSPALQLLQHIRDEAHRFAKRYHRVLRSIRT